MSSDVVLVSMIVALTIVITVAVQVFWSWWREVDSRQRHSVVREAARWAVLAAEYLHNQPQSGPTKLAWVLAHLRQRFPALEETVLTRYAEKAVSALNVGKAATVAARLNGKGPRHDNQ